MTTAAERAVAARLQRPVMAGLTGKAAEAVTLVLLATLVPRMLGPADYGSVAVALTVVAIGSVALTLGGATLLARYVPAAVPERRAGVALALTGRLARNRAALLVAIAAAAALASAVFPDRVPPLLTALVLLALVLNVAATLALQADLGLGRAGAWSARYPVQNAVLIAGVLVLHQVAGVPGAVGAIALAAAVAFVLGAVVLAPVLRARPAAVPLPPGALRFGMFQAAGGALTQLAQRGGVVAVALLTGSAIETGFTALAVGIALAATYTVAQLFTVVLPTVAGFGEPAEAVTRRLAGWLVVLTTAVGCATVLVVDRVVPIAFGAAYAGAAPAFGAALAMVVLAPANALAVQAAALRWRPAATVHAALAGAVVFVAVAVATVPAWGAVGATAAMLAAAATSVLAAVVVLPGAIGFRLACGSLAGAALVVMLAVVT